MMKRWRIEWSEIVSYTSIIEAHTAEEAKEALMDGDTGNELASFAELYEVSEPIEETEG